MNNTDIIFFDGHSTQEVQADKSYKCISLPAKDLFATTTKKPDEVTAKVITPVSSECVTNGTKFKVTRPLKGTDKSTTLEKEKNYTFVYAINSKGEVGS